MKSTHTTSSIDTAGTATAAATIIKPFYYIIQILLPLLLLPSPLLVLYEHIYTPCIQIRNATPTIPGVNTNVVSRPQSYCVATNIVVFFVDLYSYADYNYPELLLRPIPVTLSPTFLLLIINKLVWVFIFMGSLRFFVTTGITLCYAAIQQDLQARIPCQVHVF